MMKTIHDKDDWHLIRNDNGEWISDMNVLFLESWEVENYQRLAAKYGLELSVQHYKDGSQWCYRHEVEAICNMLHI